jgi:hypothetical protein
MGRNFRRRFVRITGETSAGMPIAISKLASKYRGLIRALANSMPKMPFLDAEGV